MFFLAAIPAYVPLAAATATVIAALGGVLKMVLDAAKGTEDRHTAAIERIEARQEKFLGNHMSTNTHALERVADRLENVEDVVRDVRAAVGWRRPDNGSH